MPKNIHPCSIIAVWALCLTTTFASAQDTTRAAVAPQKDLVLSQDVNYTPPRHRLDQQLVYVQWDILMNPIYFTQITGNYRLNGQPQNITPRPKFYALLPGQSALLGSAITDEAGCYYASFRICAFDHSHLKFFQNMRLIVGATHDKLQTGSNTVYYKYTNGGTEATALLEKNLSPKITRLNYSRLRLIFNWNAQAGLFASLAKIQTNMIWKGDTIVGINNNRLQFPNPRSGWGGIAASNIEVGVPLCGTTRIEPASNSTWAGKTLFRVFRHVALTVGSRLLLEYLHGGTDVSVNGMTGYHLTHNNFAFAFCGPILGVRIIDKL
ncbi:MAG TPA: hypothetical protein VNV35_12175 [Puia sp.]|nr:hypothetical protein [Puia sp.]